MKLRTQQTNRLDIAQDNVNELKDGSEGIIQSADQTKQKQKPYKRI